MGALYKLTFPNGKAYIGITSKTARRRVVVHRSHARKGRDCPLHRAIRKYGEQSFATQVLVVASDWDYLCDLEKRAIKAFGTRTPGGYNVTVGGEGVLGVPVSEAARRRMSAQRKGTHRGNKFALGYRHTPEALEKIAAAGRGRVFSAERLAKMGAKKIGNKYCVGRVLSAEQRQRISAAQKGRVFTPEHRAKLSAARRRFVAAEART